MKVRITWMYYSSSRGICSEPHQPQASWRAWQSSQPLKLPTLRDAMQINGVKVVSIGLESRGEYGWLRQECGWTI